MSPKKWAVLGVAGIVAIAAFGIAYSHPGSSSSDSGSHYGSIAVLIACWSAVIASRRRKKCGGGSEE
jgi:hypothetical protein